jgi:hypothetical protein
MQNRSYMYAWIYYCTHQYLLIFFETKNKIPSKFDFRFEFSDFNKIFFALCSKYGNLFMAFIKKYIILLIH